MATTVQQASARISDHRRDGVGKDSTMGLLQRGNVVCAEPVTVRWRLPAGDVRNAVRDSDIGLPLGSHAVVMKAPAPAAAREPGVRRNGRMSSSGQRSSEQDSRSRRPPQWSPAMRRRRPSPALWARRLTPLRPWWPGPEGLRVQNARRVAAVLGLKVWDLRTATASKRFGPATRT